MGRVRTWTRETVAVAIRKRHEAGTLGRTWSENASLRVAAHKRYGSWGNALSEVLGIAPPVRRTWSRERIVAAIRDRHRDGASLRRTWDEDPLLYSAAKRYFGTWHAAAAAAGFELPRRRTWTAERVVAELQSRHRRGERCTSTADPGLYGAALRHFDGWGAALAAAGVPSAPPVTGRRWSPELVLSELRRWHEIRVVNVGPRRSGVAGRRPPFLRGAAERPRRGRSGADRGLDESTDRRGGAGPARPETADRRTGRRRAWVGLRGAVPIRRLARGARGGRTGNALSTASGARPDSRGHPGRDPGVAAAQRPADGRRRGRSPVGPGREPRLRHLAGGRPGRGPPAVAAPVDAGVDRRRGPPPACRRHAAGEALTSHRNGVVATAARRFFPNWSAVLEAAGIEREVGS